VKNTARAAAIVGLAVAIASLGAGTAVAQECDRPNMLIILDKSGSMGDNSKWTQAKAAIQYLFNNYGPQIRWGLMLFAHDSNCAAGQVDVAIGDNQTQAILNKINSVSPDSNTPIASTLYAAYRYAGLHDPARLNYIMFLTDGQETCSSGDAVNNTAALFAAGVKTFVIGFGSGVDANVLNGMAQAGGTARSGATKYYVASDQSSLQTAMTTIAQLATTRPCKNACGTGVETCVNQQWANCTAPTTCCTDTNTPCDTGKQGICAEGQMKCVNGSLTCVQTNQQGTETCNGLDDDCDGDIDNNVAPQACTNSCGNAGNKYCVMGTWTQCDAAPCCVDTNAPCNTGKPGICADGRMKCVADKLECVQTNQPKPDEECNGLDDNCNGEVDEGDPGGGGACDTGLPGECAAGHLHCKGGMVKCVQDVQAEPEKCDKLDNDCDGTVDNGNPGGGKLCSTGLKGECAKGHTSCIDGEVVCVQDKQSEPEKCDGLDNNCDGSIDDGVTNACGTCGPAPKEICNNFDDDCDKTIDDEAECPPQKYCINGECVSRCVNNECPGELVCRDNYCVNPCNGVKCSSGEDCIGGTCVDLCKNVECKDDEVCRHGECLPDDCYASGCDEGRICRGGKCVADQCAGVDCDPYKEQFCRDGVCVTSCAVASCGFGEKCIDGACVTDVCYEVECDPGKVCNAAGECIDDPCEGTTCGIGRVCRDGSCIDDPCTGIECPKPGEVCRMGQCYSGAEQPDGGTDGGDAAHPDGETPDGEADDVGGAGWDTRRDAGRKDTGGEANGDDEAFGGDGDLDSGGTVGEGGGCSCATVNP